MRDTAVLYLDSNIFITAAVDLGELGKKTVALLAEIQRGEVQAVTSALTFDEVFWEVKKHRGFEKAVETAEAMLSFPNLELVSADREIVFSALQIVKRYRMAPRDAIHVATAMAEKVDTFISLDTDFNKVTELQRESP